MSTTAKLLSLLVVVLLVGMILSAREILWKGGERVQILELQNQARRLQVSYNSVSQELKRFQSRSSLEDTQPLLHHQPDSPDSSKTMVPHAAGRDASSEKEVIGHTHMQENASVSAAPARAHISSEHTNQGQTSRAHPPIRVLIFGRNHTNQFYGPRWLDNMLGLARNCSVKVGQRKCEWFADPDIPNNVDSALMISGFPQKGPGQRQQVQKIYREKWGKALNHTGFYYTEAYDELNVVVKWNYKLSVVRHPAIRLSEGCESIAIARDKLRSGALNLSSIFDRPKGAVSFVANCAKGRADFLRNVSKHIRVDHRGVCLRNVKVPKKTGRGDKGWPRTKAAQVEEYKFLFALENKQFPHYVSEKIYGGMEAGAIPIYYGAKYDEVVDLVPPNSFIYVSAYDDGRALADLLRRLETNRTLFNSYFAWGLPDLEALYRKHHCDRHWTCRVCDFLNTDLPSK